MMRAFDGFGGLYLLFSKNTLGLPAFGSVCCAHAIPSETKTTSENRIQLGGVYGGSSYSLQLEAIQFRDQSLDALLAVNLDEALFLV